jgi:iron complex outermembrane receptor protein
MRARSTRSLLLVTSLTTLWSLGTLAARAQTAGGTEQPAPTAETTTPRGIEEIVVTAERREQSIQDIGVSISAFSAEDLESQNIQDIHDLQLKVPGLVATGGLPQLTLRGIGNDIVGPGVDPGFALHTNGVYATQLATALLDFYDLERVEVISGPQGTLGGRNTTGGSMYLYTQKPTDRWELSGDAEVDSYGKVRTRVTGNVPLGEKFGMRIVGAWESASKPYDADGLDQSFASNALGAGPSVRLSLQWRPTESLTFDLIGSYSVDSSQGGMIRYLGDYPSYPAGQSPLFFGSPDYTGASSNPDDALELRQNERQDQKYEVAWGQLMAEWDLGPIVASSNSHYAFWDYGIKRDQDSSDLDIEHLELYDTHKSFTQEITFKSDYESRFQWLIGGNFQTDDAPETLLPVRNNQVNAAAASFVILNALTFTPATICGDGTEDCVFTELPSDYDYFDLVGDTQTDTAGAFFDATLDLTERVTLHGGVRYSYTRRQFHDTSRFDVFAEAYDVVNDNLCETLIAVPLPQAVCFFVLVTSPSGGFLTPANTAFLLPLRGDRTFESLNMEEITFDKTWNSVTGNIRVEYKPTDETLLYASFAKGERAGGFNWLEGFAAQRGFNPEENLAYEIGAKGTFWNELLLTASAFYYDYTNKFTTQTVNNTTLTENAGDADVRGVEVQFLWAATDELRFNGNIGWLRARYRSDFFSQDKSLSSDNPTGFDPTGIVGDRHGAGPGAQGAVAENINGNPLNRAPDWSINVGAEYTLELGSFGFVTPRLDFSWRDEVYHRQFKNSLDRQGAYTKTDLAVRWDQGEDGL